MAENHGLEQRIGGSRARRGVHRVAADGAIDVPQSGCPDFAVVVLFIVPVGRVDLRSVHTAQAFQGSAAEDPIFEKLSLEAAAALCKSETGKDVAEAFTHRASFGSVGDGIGNAPARHLIVLNGVAVLV